MNAQSKPTQRIALRLFVTGSTTSSEKARHALGAICEDLRARQPALDVSLDVIDVLVDPDSALMEQVFATPTVIRVAPGPSRRLFGDLSSPEMVMIGLQISPALQPA
jgi:circadian clock protein KaiB